MADSSRNAFMAVIDSATRASDTMSHAELTASKITSMYSDQQAEYISSTDIELESLLNDMNGLDDDSGDLTRANTAYQVAATEQSSGMSYFSGIVTRADADVGTFSDSMSSMFSVFETIEESMTSACQSITG